MLRVLGRKTSINVQKVMWLIEEMNVDVERVDIGSTGKIREEHVGYTLERIG